MTITAISDTHGQHKELTPYLPEADCIVHAGDIAGTGTVKEFRDFLNWFSSLDYKYKIFIAGNSDRLLYQLPKESFKLIEKKKNLIYLEDESIFLEGLTFYGSPWIKPYNGKQAFELGGDETREACWSRIPVSTDVLITHSPIYKFLDKINTPTAGEDPYLGCSFLAKHALSLKYLKLHICGHAHAGRGTCKPTNVWFCNASVLTEDNELYDDLELPVYDISPF